MKLPEGCVYRSYRSAMLTKHNIMPILISSLTNFVFFLPTMLFPRDLRIPYDHPLYSRIYFAYYARIKIRARDVITGAVRSSNVESGKEIDQSGLFRCRDPTRGCISEKKVPRNAPRAQNEDDRNGGWEIEGWEGRRTYGGWGGGGGKEDRQMRFPSCRRRRSSCCTQPPCRSLLALCEDMAVISYGLWFDCASRAKTRNCDTPVNTVSIVSPYLAFRFLRFQPVVNIIR